MVSMRFSCFQISAGISLPIRVVSDVVKVILLELCDGGMLTRCLLFCKMAIVAVFVNRVRRHRCKKLVCAMFSAAPVAVSSAKLSGWVQDESENAGSVAGVLSSFPHAEVDDYAEETEWGWAKTASSDDHQPPLPAVQKIAFPKKDRR